MPGACPVGPAKLEGVSPAVHEEAEGIRHHAGGRFKTKLPHPVLPEVRWTGPPLYVRGEIMRVLCHMDRLEAPAD